MTNNNLVVNKANVIPNVPKQMNILARIKRTHNPKVIRVLRKIGVLLQRLQN